MNQKIMIADDHPLFRAALRTAVGRARPHAEVIEVGSITQARAALARTPGVSLLLLDLMMGDSRGLAGLLLLRGEHPALPIAVVSALEDHDVANRVLEYGALGFIPKSSDPGAIAQAVDAVLDGEVWTPYPQAAPALDDGADRLASLTPAQLKVLIGLMDGRLNKQIAYDMSISEATVKAHVTALMRKLKVQNRTQAVIAARALGLEAPAMA